MFYTFFAVFRDGNDFEQFFLLEHWGMTQANA
jgi:hypothetical protein